MIQLLISVDEITEGSCGKMNGKGGDLPTAAQFEYAARYDTQDVQPEQLVIWDNRHESTVSVRSGYQNRFGVFNLLGNVWESMRDAYESDFYSRMPGTDPYNPLTDPSRQFEEFRGGSFDVDRTNARAAYHSYDCPVFRANLVGFRCVWPQDSE